MLLLVLLLATSLLIAARALDSSSCCIDSIRVVAMCSTSSAGPCIVLQQQAHLHKLHDVSLLGLVAASQTNNPRKMNVLQALGIRVTGRIPCVVSPGELNQVRVQGAAQQQQQQQQWKQQQQSTACRRLGRMRHSCHVEPPRLHLDSISSLVPADSICSVLFSQHDSFNMQGLGDRFGARARIMEHL